MEKEFVTVEIAKRLKELGFNEWCLAAYYEQKDKAPSFGYSPYLDSEPGKQEYLNNDYKGQVAAPLYQQVIDWIREKHDIHYHVRPVNEIHPNPQFLGYVTGFEGSEYYEKYEKAREAAILNSIDLISKK